MAINLAAPQGSKKVVDLATKLAKKLSKKLKR